MVCGAEKERDDSPNQSGRLEGQVKRGVHMKGGRVGDIQI